MVTPYERRAMPAGLISGPTLRAGLTLESFLGPHAALRIANLAMLNRAQRALRGEKSAFGEAYSNSVSRPYQ